MYEYIYEQIYATKIMNKENSKKRYNQNCTVPNIKFYFTHGTGTWNGITQFTHV